MGKYRIISDGSCDLAPELARERGIDVVPFYVSTDGKNYLREGLDLGEQEFYDWMVSHNGEYPKSSMPSAQDFLEAFEAAAAAGEDVICLCITQKFSSAFHTATAARGLFLEEHPDVRVTVIDTTVNTVCQGLVVLEACDMRDAGVPYDELVRALEEIKSTGRIFFTVGSLDYLLHGGRMGRLAGIAGSLLNIRPVITLHDGEIYNSGIARGRRRSLEKPTGLFMDYVRKEFGSPADYRVVVGYGYDYAEAEQFRDGVEAELRSMGHVVRVPIRRIGATISVHTGPYPLGVAVLGRHALCPA